MPQPAAEGCLGQWSVSTYHLVCRYSAPGRGFLMEVALYQVSILYPFCALPSSHYCQIVLIKDANFIG